MALRGVYDDGMSTGNPYAAPQTPLVYRTNVNVPPGAASRAPLGPLLNRLRLGFGSAHVVLGSAAFGGAVAGLVSHDMELLRASALGMWASAGFFFAWVLVDVLWLYRFWSWIPPEHRYTSMWRSYISPAAACGFCFVPIFSIYWMLVLYLGYDDIMERLRVEVPCSKPPVKVLAIITIVVFFMFWPAAPIVSYLLCRRLEEMADEMHLWRMTSLAGVPAPRAPNA
jgi:hypothetical protein